MSRKDAKAQRNAASCGSGFVSSIGIPLRHLIFNSLRLCAFAAKPFSK